MPKSPRTCLGSAGWQLKRCQLRQLLQKPSLLAWRRRPAQYHCCAAPGGIFPARKHKPPKALFQRSQLGPLVQAQSNGAASSSGTRQRSACGRCCWWALSLCSGLAHAHQAWARRCAAAALAWKAWKSRKHPHLLPPPPLPRLPRRHKGRALAGRWHCMPWWGQARPSNASWTKEGRLDPRRLQRRRMHCAWRRQVGASPVSAA